MKTMDQNKPTGRWFSRGEHYVSPLRACDGSNGVFRLDAHGILYVYVTSPYGTGYHAGSGWERVSPAGRLTRRAPLHACIRMGRSDAHRIALRVAGADV